MKCTIAVAQIDSAPGDLSGNLKKHLEYIRRAKSGGADLVVFPELSLTGYSIKDANWDVALRLEETHLLSEVVEESKEIAILFGAVEESAEYGIYNSALFADAGNLTAVHRKVYPPTYGMFEEMRYFSAGKSVRAFDSRIGRLGVLVCEDMWHLPLPYLLAQDGAELIIGIAAAPTRMSGAEGIAPTVRTNVEQHKAYARLLSTFVVFCNRVGYEDGVNFWGGSEIVGPDGDVMVQAKLFDEDLIFAGINSTELRRARRFSRHFLDDDVELVMRELRRISEKKKQGSI